MTGVRDRAGVLATRLRKAAAFIAIVWAVAASFIAFELISMRGLDLVLAYPSVFGRLLLSRATQESKACDVQPGEPPPGTAGGMSRSDARTGSWLLGLRLGQDAQLRQWATADPQLLGASTMGMEQLTGMLSVPSPGIFVPRNVADANREFVSFIEVDERGTAHQLAVSYSPEACRLYKLGALWGYSMPARVALPGHRAVFAVEIHHYARQARLPETLWQPMVESTPRDATRDDLAEDTWALTEGVTKHLSGQP